MVVLDADVLIDLHRGFPAATAWFVGLTVMPSASGLAVMELMQGARNSREVARVFRLTRSMPHVWPTASDCKRALDDFAYRRLSHGLDLIDSLTAACAVGLGAELHTFNLKHYRTVPGLVTVQPYLRRRKP